MLSSSTTATASVKDDACEIHENPPPDPPESTCKKEEEGSESQASTPVSKQVGNVMTWEQPASCPSQN